MKRLLAILLLAAPLLAQTPTPTPTATVTPTRTPTVTPTRTPTPTPTPALPVKYSLAQHVRPGFGTFSTEGTVNLLGDTYYATDARTFGRVAGNITTTRKFWRQVGTGSASAAPAWDTLVAGDIPNLAASIITSGTIATARLGSGTANSTTFLRGDQTWVASGSGTVTSISTTAPITGCSSPCTATATLGIAAFNTTAPSPGAVPDATGAGAGTYLDKSGNWTTPAGAVTSPLTTKGDLWGYSTGDTRVAVGADGTYLKANSSDAKGVSYDYPGVGTLRVLKETVFAGITPTSYTNGNTYTIDGSAYVCTVAGNGAVDMVATGLRLRQGTTSSTNSQIMKITNGGTGDFLSVVGESRFRRGKWGFWVRLASYDFTNGGTAVYAGGLVLNASGKWGVGLRSRVKNFLGAPNSATGGIAADFWWQGANPNPGSYPGVSTADVLLAYFRSPEIIDVYYGTYSGGWPTMEAMTLMGTIQMQTTQFISAANSGPVIAATVDIWFQVGGSAATSGTYEAIFDRWRITTWE